MSRRLGSIISAGALAVGLAAPTLLAQPAQARRADQVASLRIMQLNIKTTLSTPNWIADARKAMSMSDIADFNEASRQVHLDALRNLLEASGWDGWWPAKSAGKENPITWNASKFTLVKSELRSGINKILQFITYLLVPAGALIIYTQLFTTDAGWKESVLRMVGALVPMVPEGLVLMTSIAFAVGVMRA